MEKEIQDESFASSSSAASRESPAASASGASSSTGPINAYIWKIIDTYFHDNPRSLVNHHIQSFNDFYKHGIYQVFRDTNPITIVSKFSNNEFKHQCKLYMGGKNGDKLYFGKPAIYDPKQEHFMFPNEARLRNMTYGITIHYDIDVEFIDILDETEKPSLFTDEYLKQLENGELDITEIDNTESADAFTDLFIEGGSGKKQLIKTNPKNAKALKEKASSTVHERRSNALNQAIAQANVSNTSTKNVQIRTMTLEKIYLGRFPIMIQSDMCILSGMTSDNRSAAGECKHDLGGYFIIDGKEKVIIPQEKLGDNMLNIKSFVNQETGDEDEEKEIEALCSAEIKSVSENIAKPRRTLSVKLLAPSKQYANGNIVVNIPNVRKPIPLFILFRALGITSDKDIIRTCLLDLDKNNVFVDLFIPSVHDAEGILTQQNALYFISLLTKWKSIAYVHEILHDYFLPHVGEGNYQEKAYFLGHMVFRMLSVHLGLEAPTDRDNFKYKRVEVVGTLIADLFREYLTIQNKTYHLGFESRLYFNEQRYEDHLDLLIYSYYKDVTKDKIVETGFKKAFKGNWGSVAHTKRIGIIQDLNRLSFNSALAHLRKVCLPMDTSLKVVEPRKLHPSQWGYIDPLDTPDGANIGFHKSLAIATQISRGYSRENLISWLKQNTAVKMLIELHSSDIASMTKVFINGYWYGCVNDPIETVAKMKLYRRNALIPIQTSISFETKANTIYLFTDSGRLLRPLFYFNNNKVSFDRKRLSTDFTWNELITGFMKKRPANFDPNTLQFYTLNGLYGDNYTESNIAHYKEFFTNKALLDYIDCNETETALIALDVEDVVDGASTTKYTHCEIHNSLLFGVMCNQIAFAENNQSPRDLFSCGQSKQACSVYHTNYQVRMDKTGIILNYGQIPLVKTRYGDIINQEGNPYGENAIVAIMCYSGYNVEDAVLVNEGALKRGLFRTSYFTTYEAREEHNQEDTDAWLDTVLTNPLLADGKIKLKSGYSYDKLDEFGLIKEGVYVDDETILIGMAIHQENGKQKDCSVVPKKGQTGIVDKVFVTDDDEGKRVIKVRIMDQRIPNMGDKFASRVGQKGTIGLVIPERDMPFTKDGLIPDIIVNPHAIPSRMTVGQIIESITGKVCATYGGFADCTAFNQKGSKVELFGKLLSREKYHHTGNEILYNGFTGEQIEADIFIGPTYYMRLKHMVKDKINYRRRGNNAMLTRQPVGGRANDGGLRIGEMERDTILSHGSIEFLREAMMDRADKYKVTVCNKTGCIAVHNQGKNTVFSLSVDGPIQSNVASLGTKLCKPEVNEGDLKVEYEARFGRDFSVVEIPYSFKLFIQELQAMNIQTRLITDDNLRQLNSLVGHSLGNLKEDDSNQQEFVYGYKKLKDPKTLKTYWVDKENNKYNSEPIVFSNLRYIQGSKSQLDTYLVDDIIYYLDESISDNPWTEWRITKIDEEEGMLTMVNLTADTNIEKEIKFDLKRMRLQQHRATISKQRTPFRTEQYKGESIYGWKIVESSKYKGNYFWQDTTNTNRQPSWTEPPELTARRELLNLPMPTVCFAVNDIIYDLSSYEKYENATVSIANVKQLYRVSQRSFDSDSYTYALQLDRVINGVVPDTRHTIYKVFDPEYMRLFVTEPVDNGTTEVTKTIFGGKKSHTDKQKKKDTFAVIDELYPSDDESMIVFDTNAKPTSNNVANSIGLDTMVYWIKDHRKPKRIWYTKKHGHADNTYYIATEDTEFLTTDECYNLVHEMDLVTIPKEDIEQALDKELGAVPSMAQSNIPPIYPSNGFVFAPSIKLIAHGTDNSTGGNIPNTNQPNADINVPVKIPFIGMGGSNNEASEDSKPEIKGGSKKQSETSPSLYEMASKMTKNFIVNKLL